MKARKIAVNFKLPITITSSLQKGVIMRSVKKFQIFIGNIVHCSGPSNIELIENGYIIVGKTKVSHNWILSQWTLWKSSDLSDYCVYYC